MPADKPKKFKISDIAKEIPLTGKDIAAKLNTASSSDKFKSSSSILIEDYDLLLNALTLDKSVNINVESLEEYLSDKKSETVEAEPKPKPKLFPSKGATSVIKKPKTSEEKNAAAEKATVKPQEKPAGKKEDKKRILNPFQSKQSAPGNPAVPPVTAKPTASATNASAEKPQSTATASDKFNNRAYAAQAKQDKKTDKKLDKKTAAPAQHGERMKLDTGKIADKPVTTDKKHTVDTRGSYIEMEKYNEKYEQLATSPAQGNKQGNKKDDYIKKQKIQQKSQQKGKPSYSQKRETEAQKLKRIELERARNKQLEILIPDEILVSELASRLKVNVAEIIKRLMKLGVMATMNQTIDYDTAALIADELGAKYEKEVIITVEERLFDETEDKQEDLETRDPVVVVMGHVDHGKTSLLDRIRNANVVAGEAGGITQHIGAYRVTIDGRRITFLDTPGHEAFTSMRARGAQVTDIAILVVAADDGIMPQTIEAINHAKAANVSIIVAINKIDKDGANPDRIKQELTEHGLVIEEWGGDVICCEVSAKKGIGIENLLENVILTADIKELKANPNRRATGAVIEARLDKGRGPVATLLVQNGTLNTGDVIIAGTAVGRVRVMLSDKGKVVKHAKPSVPVEITGLAEVPSAGDIFRCVEDEKLARELVEKRKHDQKQEIFSQYKKVTLDNIFSQIAEGSIKELPIIVKADVQGSVEAVRQSLEKISNEEVRVRVIHGGVGAIRESDVMLANASNAIIVGFNVRPDPIAAESAARDSVDIRMYRIIYDAIDEIQQAMRGMLAPKYKITELGRIEVRNVFKITNVGVVAGCHVLSGKVNREAEIRVVRDGIVIAEDKMSSLQRFKDTVKEVAAGYECGITLERFNDIKEGDIFESFITEEVKQV